MGNQSPPILLKTGTLGSGPNAHTMPVGLDSECMIELLGLAHFNKYDRNELIAVCYAMWPHFNPDKTKRYLRSGTRAREVATQPWSDEWADECATYASSPEQFP